MLTDHITTSIVLSLFYWNKDFNLIVWVIK